MRSATERGEGRTIAIAIDVRWMDQQPRQELRGRPDCVPPGPPLCHAETKHGMFALRKVYFANCPGERRSFSSVVAVCYDLQDQELLPDEKASVQQCVKLME